MRLFDQINAELLKTESRTPYVYPEPRVNPSELSAYLTDNRKASVVGRCQRQTIFKLFGVPVTEPMRPNTARIFRLGRYMEEEVAGFLKKAGLFVAAGVRKYDPSLIMSFELDIVCMDPATKQAVIVENKTVKGEWNMSQIQEGKPKDENLMQLCLYLDYIRTGKRLKDLIREGMKDRDVAEEFGDFSMNRIEVLEDRLEQMNDGPIVGKLLYEDRETCSDGEVDVTLFRNESDGLVYPLVNGVPHFNFSMDSVYQRRAQVQQYWTTVVNEAKQVLAGMGIYEPQPPSTAFGPNVNDPGFKMAKKDFWNRVGEYFRTLPPDRWPAPDYDYKYSDQKLAFLHREKLLRKTEVTAMNKGQRIGDFNCDYCDWQKTCVAARYPEYRALLTTIQPVQGPPVEQRA
jgi:hypothetical protein